MSARTILRNLKNLNQYLNRFHQSQQSTYFEQLLAEAFSNILYLPFYSCDNDDPYIRHRVTWHGSSNRISKAPGEMSDAIAYCYGFCFTIEATLRTGANQWAKEFAQSIRHCGDFCSSFCSSTTIQPKDIFALLICTVLHRDTYRSVRSNPRAEYKLIPIEISDLSKILETSILAFTMKHLELRNLLNQISDSIRKTSSLDDFRSAVDSLLTNWQKGVLKVEKSAFVGVKSYEAMRKINRTHIGTSEILQKLERHPTVKKYLKISGDELSCDIIADGLIQQSLAFQLSPTYEGEKLFSPVPFTDFRERGLRLIKTVEEING